MKEFLKSLASMQTVFYAIAGGMTAVVNLLSFHIFLRALHLDVTVSNVLSIILAIIFSYIMNKVMVFHSKTFGLTGLAFEFAKFIGGRLLTMGIEVGGVFLLHNVLRWGPMASKVSIQVIVVILNYLIGRFFVFSGQKKPEDQTAKEQNG